MTDENGEPYSHYLDEMVAYLEQAEAVSQTDKFYGYLPASEELAFILTLFWNNAKESDLDNHWLILAYYEAVL